MLCYVRHVTIMLSYGRSVHPSNLYAVTDCVSQEGKAIASIFRVCAGHDRNSPLFESQGQRSMTSAYGCVNTVT